MRVLSHRTSESKEASLRSRSVSQTDVPRTSLTLRLA
jgi:hypothetical protein